MPYHGPVQPHIFSVFAGTIKGLDQGAYQFFWFFGAIKKGPSQAYYESFGTH